MDNKSLAILGLVLSILTTVPGIVVSAIALKKFKESGETDGKGFATAGLIVGIIEVALCVLIYGCVCSIGVCAALAEGAAMLIL